MRIDPKLILSTCVACAAALATFTARAESTPEIKIGMIGLDTSHVISVAALLNDPAAKDHIPGARVVCAFKVGSPDMEMSTSRIEGFASQLRDKYGVQLVDSIAEVIARSDAIIIMSVDGRVHLQQAREVFASGKPVFLDKPLAANLRDSVAIVRLAEQTHTTFFSASPFRFSPSLKRLRETPVGAIRSAIAYGNGGSEPHMPPLFFEGIHPVEALFTVLGTGCDSVSCTHTDDSEVATGVWSGGRTGVVIGLRTRKTPVGVTAFGQKGPVSDTEFRSEGFAPLTREIVTFFQTRRAPVSPHDTLEIIAFLEAADQSQQRHGASVSVKDLLAKELAAQ
jgi:predicted dehydrogenase